jgi:hypothetical protein
MSLSQARYSLPRLAPDGPNPLGRDCRPHSHRRAWRIVRETTAILLEATPKRLHLSALVDDMKQGAEVCNVHDLHV